MQNKIKGASPCMDDVDPQVETFLLFVFGNI